MTNNPSLEAWKVFLRARIAQEQGNDEESLKLLETALKTEPENRHFLVAQAIGLSRLGRNTESLTSTIVAKYGELAKNLSGENDKPGPWVKELQVLLDNAEGVAEAVDFSVW